MLRIFFLFGKIFGSLYKYIICIFVVETIVWGRWFNHIDRLLSGESCIKVEVNVMGRNTDLKKWYHVKKIQAVQTTTV